MSVQRFNLGPCVELKSGIEVPLTPDPGGYSQFQLVLRGMPAWGCPGEQVGVIEATGYANGRLVFGAPPDLPEGAYMAELEDMSSGAVLFRFCAEVRPIVAGAPV